MALLFVGKLLIAVGLCFQAYTLYEDKASAVAFDSRLATVLKSCDCIPADIQAHLKEYLRLVVVGLLGFSSLMVFFKSALLKLPVLLGLVTLFVLRNAPFTSIPTFKDHAFWESLAVIGGVIYLMGAESCGPCHKT